jgi:ABC-type dipeptide/oligopeptide/nickel transport system ATPase component
MQMNPLLEIHDLHVVAKTKIQEFLLLNGVELVLEEKEILGLIGETGAGKSLTAWSIIGLLNPELTVNKGSIKLQGRELLGLSNDELSKMRGKKISIIVQNPSNFLDPLRPIGRQLAQIYQRHSGKSYRYSYSKALEMLRQVEMPDAERRMRSYPHELSGGMAQRVMIRLT